MSRDEEAAEITCGIFVFLIAIMGLVILAAFTIWVVRHALQM
jgi:hypothetical protein